MITKRSIPPRLLAMFAEKLPPIRDVMLFPFPLPLLPPEPPTLSPLQAGVITASECLRLAFTARALGADPLRVYDEFGEWCPTYPRLPRLPPVPPFPVPDPHPEWLGEFYLGLAARLSLEQLRDNSSKPLAALVDKAISALESVMTPERWDHS